VINCRRKQSLSETNHAQARRATQLVFRWIPLHAPHWSREIIGSCWHATRMTRFKVNGWILQAPNLVRVLGLVVVAAQATADKFVSGVPIPLWHTNDSQNDRWSAPGSGPTSRHRPRACGRSPPRTQPTPRRATTTAKCALQCLFVRLTPKTTLERHNLPMENRGPHLPGTGARHTAGASRRSTRSRRRSRAGSACVSECPSRLVSARAPRVFWRLAVVVDRSFVSLPFSLLKSIVRSLGRTDGCAVQAPPKRGERTGGAAKLCNSSRKMPESVSGEKQRRAGTQRGEKISSSSASPSSVSALAQRIQHNPIRRPRSLPHEHHTRRQQ
jgi:hypothetical protein